MCVCLAARKHAPASILHLPLPKHSTECKHLRGRLTWASSLLPAIDPITLPRLTGTSSAGTLTSKNTADGPAASLAALGPPTPPDDLGRIAITPTETSRQSATTRTNEPHPSRRPFPGWVLGGRAGGIFRLLNIHRPTRVCAAGGQLLHLLCLFSWGSGRGRARIASSETHSGSQAEIGGARNEV